MVGLYDELLAIVPSPVVELNRAIAVGIRDGPDAGLALLDALGPRLPRFWLLPAAQADLLARAGRPTSARCYRATIELTDARAEPRRPRAAAGPDDVRSERSPLNRRNPAGG